MAYDQFERILRYCVCTRTPPHPFKVPPGLGVSHGTCVHTCDLYVRRMCRGETEHTPELRRAG